MHDTNCQYREEECPLCHIHLPVTAISSHFKETHEKYFIDAGKIIIHGNEICQLPASCIFLVAYPNLTCWVSVSIDSCYEINVKPIFPLTQPYLITVTLGTDTDSIILKNKPMEKPFSLDMKSTMEILKADYHELKTEIKILAIQDIEDTASTSQQSDEHNLYPTPSSGSEVLSEIKEMIATNLKCQTCYELMVQTNIYTCTTGHSVCDYCRNALTECRLCNGGFLGARNYSLEEISRQYASMM